VPRKAAVIATLLLVLVGATVVVEAQSVLLDVSFASDAEAA
jgi:hypothetical protein